MKAANGSPIRLLSCMIGLFSGLLMDGMSRLTAFYVACCRIRKSKCAFLRLMLFGNWNKEKIYV
jgi:hypothetical protein